METPTHTVQNTRYLLSNGFGDTQTCLMQACEECPPTKILVPNYVNYCISEFESRVWYLKLHMCNFVLDTCNSSKVSLKRIREQLLQFTNLKFRFLLLQSRICLFFVILMVGIEWVLHNTNGVHRVGILHIIQHALMEDSVGRQ